MKFSFKIIAFAILAFLNFSVAFAQKPTILVRGKVKPITSTLVSCTSKKGVCGYYSPGPVKAALELADVEGDYNMEKASGVYYFPKDYTGQYPENVKTDANGFKYVENATFNKTINAQKEEEVTIEF